MILFLLACASEPRDGIGVGNPGDADKPKPSVALALAPTDGARAASTAVDALLLWPCDGGDSAEVALDAADLLSPTSTELPEGLWCELELVLSEPLSITGDDYTLSLMVDRVSLYSRDGVSADGALLLELGSPGWYDPALGDVAPGDPDHALLVDMIAHGSAAFIDDNTDGVLDDDERDAVATGPAHPDDETPTFWVAVGEEGVRRTSFDNGLTWTEPLRDSGDDRDLDLFAVAGAQGRAIAVGGWNTYGRALRTFDGLTWEEYIIDTPLYGLLWHENRWIGVGNKAMLWSWDGVTWEPGTVGDGYYKSVAASLDDGRLVTVGLDGVYAWSDDGVSWTEPDPLDGLPDLYSVVWSGLFMAVGDNGLVLRSLDGETWEEVSPPDAGNLYGLAHDGVHFFAADGSTLYRTLNGDFWEEDPAPIKWLTLSQTYWTWVGIGSGDALLTSDDGISWTEQSPSSGDDVLTSVAFRPRP